MRRTIVSLLPLVLCGTAPVAAQDLRAFVLASSCLACHGDASPDGAGIPAIAGKPALSIANAMRDFRAARRESTIMQRLARGYSDDEIDRLAAWFAAQPVHTK